MSRWRAALRAAPARSALLGLLALVALAARTAMPIDETRYLAVAWEMWQRGDFLVPHLNGVPYSHKPPLLFWLVHAGWWLFGVNDVTPRLVVPLCALATLLATSAIARALWPQAPRLASRAAWILLGSLLFALFAVMLMFDVLLSASVAIGVLGLVRASQGANRGLALFAAGIGIGLLAKGPAVLVHLLGPALLAPWWARPCERRWRAWYAGIALAVLGGAAVALAWAVPAALRGGGDYASAILWGQTAHRMVDSFAHKQPVWWYVPWLPIVLAPWLAWGALWQGVRRPGFFGDTGARLALASVLPSLAALSLVSGKQLHYLLPQFPAFALLAARALDDGRVPSRPWLAVVALAAAGAVALALPHLPLRGPPAALADATSAPGAAFLALALWVGWRPRSPSAQVPVMAAAALASLAVVHVTHVRALAPAWDARPVARVLDRLQRSGRPVVHDGDYHGQFHFAGRLGAPLPTVGDRRELVAWLAAHGDGAAVVYFADPGAIDAFQALAVQPFRGRHVAVLDGRDALRVAFVPANLEGEDAADARAARRRPPQ